jgi:hypothetical protein
LGHAWDLDNRSWRKRGREAIVHYDAGPHLKVRFTSFLARLTSKTVHRCLEIAVDTMRRLGDGG